METQSFWATQPVTGERIACNNIIARFGTQYSRHILLCAHWDTRPWADQDPDSANHITPILGANDGASGVAVLLEIARCLSVKAPEICVEIVLFDAEDMGRAGYSKEYCQGSQYFADALTLPLPEAAVLLDMVGDADLRIPYEMYSYKSNPDLLNEIFDSAMRQGETAFDRVIGPAVYDDHIALLESGVQAVNLIDFDYPYWHTVDDTPDHCSPESLGIVGRVLLDWIFQRSGGK